MELRGKTVAVLVEQQYQELEVWYPYYRLREAGATVVMVSQYPGGLPGTDGSYIALMDANIEAIAIALEKGGSH